MKHHTMMSYLYTSQGIIFLISPKPSASHQFFISPHVTDRPIHSVQPSVCTHPHTPPTVHTLHTHRCARRHTHTHTRTLTIRRSVYKGASVFALLTLAPRASRIQQNPLFRWRRPLLHNLTVEHRIAYTYMYTLNNCTYRHESSVMAQLEYSRRYQCCNTPGEFRLSVMREGRHRNRSERAREGKLRSDSTLSGCIYASSRMYRSSLCALLSVSAPSRAFRDLCQRGAV